MQRYYGYGMVYELSQSGTEWSYKAIRWFSGSKVEGEYSASTPVIDGAGDIETPSFGVPGITSPWDGIGERIN